MDQCSLDDKHQYLDMMQLQPRDTWNTMHTNAGESEKLPV